MWLKRLTPDYRRRYYTNLSAILALVLFIVIVGRLDAAKGAGAIEALFLFLILFGIAMPLVRLLRHEPRLPRAAFGLYGAWVFAFFVAAAGFVFPILPAAPTLTALAAGVLLMWIFFIATAKSFSPTFLEARSHSAGEPFGKREPPNAKNLKPLSSRSTISANRITSSRIHCKEAPAQNAPGLLLTWRR